MQLIQFLNNIGNFFTFSIRSNGLAQNLTRKRNLKFEKKINSEAF